MVLIKLATALAAASMLLAAAAQDSPSATVKNPIQTPTVTLRASQLTEIGCFATGTPLENHGPWDFQSPGNCQLICLQEGKDVMALSDGVNCWCGDKIPAKSWQVGNNTCDTSCSGTDQNKCGGRNKLWVILTGNTRNKPEYYEPQSSSASSAKPTTAAPTSAAAVVTVSATPTTAAKKEDSKPNTVGIAVGVVVGIVGLFSIIGGVWFFMRRRRQKQAEEDYRRNAANVDQFVSGGKLHTSNSSMNDSRIDPSFMDRRQSNGSIADNEDYSRRILKVTNV
ncbi:hypothetical protein CC86DRAFT_393540 [Ophiobolus disseminans]|uniref:WSC domain-containing protein n=1 Tax=Ophiobolus disseminans TaxID=1469910 RepID=A0A6A7A3L3_9PLEO|nr:hypothetical protein CC86DRAFT_393540 [Ophiobolus disseminans]